MREVRYSFDQALEYFRLIVSSLIRLTVFYLLIMSISRFVIMLAYGDFVQLRENKWDLLRSYWLGVRYDFSVLCHLHFFALACLLVILVLRRQRYFESFLKIASYYYAFFFAIISALLGIDYGYFAYFHDHLNILVFDFFTDDTVALLKTFWHNYPVMWIALGFMFYSWLIYKISKHIFYRHLFSPQYMLPMSRRKTVLKFSFAVLTFLISILGARGSLATFPLGLMDATISSNEFVNKLSLNGVFTFQRALKDKYRELSYRYDNITYFGYEEDIRAAFSDFVGQPISALNPDLVENLAHQTSENLEVEKNPPHVVVLVLESFGSYWLRFQSESFNVMGALEPHFREDLYFPNFISATGATLGSILAVTLSLPRQVYGPYLSESEYLKVPLRTSSAWPFKEKGYLTRFIYGGSVGWRNLNLYLPVQGFDEVEGESVIASKIKGVDGQLNHSWGVYDEFWLEYILGELSSAQKPQFIVGLSTTNHPPYTLPKHYRKLPINFPKEFSSRFVGNLDLIRQHFETYQYMNHMLGLFLKKLKESPLAENTIVVITGDHHFNVMNYNDSELLDQEMVPLYIYLPPRFKKQNIDTTVFGSHIDIMPTIYNLALSKQKYYAMGEDMLNPKATHVALNNSSMIFSNLGAAIVQDKMHALYYEWSDKYKGQLIRTDGTQSVHKLATYFKASQAVVEQVLKEEKKHMKAEKK